MKDAFDLWWQWAEKPLDGMLMIDADNRSWILRRKTDEIVPRSMKRSIKPNFIAPAAADSALCLAIRCEWPVSSSNRPRNTDLQPVA